MKKTKEEPFEPPYVRPGDGSAIWHDAPEGFVPGTHMWYAREGPGDGLFLPPEHVVIGSHQAFFGLVPVVAAGPDVDPDAEARKCRGVNRNDLYPSHAAARMPGLLAAVKRTQEALTRAQNAHALAVNALHAARLDAAASRSLDIPSVPASPPKPEETP